MHKMDWKYRIGKRKRNNSNRVKGFKRRYSGLRTIKNIDEYLFEIKETVLEELQTHIQTDGVELAGVLTGSIINDKHYRICKISPVCSQYTTSSRTSCQRNAQIANEFILSDFEESNHKRIYIGEWHTHPEDTPTPSGIDINSIATLAQQGHDNLVGLFLIIIGRKSIYYGIHDGISLHRITPIII